MVDFGRIYDKQKFRKETAEPWAFKPGAHRYFCFFQKGKRIFIISAYQKQTQGAPRREIRRAESLRIECLSRISEEEGHGKKNR
jgi:hypothetical protein